MPQAVTHSVSRAMCCFLCRHVPHHVLSGSKQLGQVLWWWGSSKAVSMICGQHHPCTRGMSTCASWFAEQHLTPSPPSLLLKRVPPYSWALSISCAAGNLVLRPKWSHPAHSSLPHVQPSVCPSLHSKLFIRSAHPYPVLHLAGL